MSGLNVVRGVVLVLFCLGTVGCHSMMHPRADEFYQEAKGANAVETGLNLSKTMDSTIQQLVNSPKKVQFFGEGFRMNIGNGFGLLLRHVAIHPMQRMELIMKLVQEFCLFRRIHQLLNRRIHGFSEIHTRFNSGRPLGLLIKFGSPLRLILEQHLTEIADSIVERRRQATEGTRVPAPPP